MEEIEQGSARRVSRRTLALVLLGTIALAVAVGVAWALDAWWRERTAADLTRAFDATVNAIESGERQVGSTMQYDPPPGGEAEKAERVRADAVLAAERVAEARQRVDAVVILPWHTELMTAREKAGVWLDLRATGLTSLVRLGRAIYPPQGELDDARSELVRAFSVL